jgi:uncharacterized protein (DUF486 family)
MGLNPPSYLPKRLAIRRVCKENTIFELSHVAPLVAPKRYRAKHSDAIVKVLDPMRLPDMTWPAFAPLLFLPISNVFMTFAWYGQLRFPDRPLWIVVLASWGIAFVEYCFAVPANRIGHTVYSAAQLKTMQEIITLIVFGVFSVTYLNEAIRWNHVAAFCCLVLAGYFAFAKW